MTHGSIYSILEFAEEIRQMNPGDGSTYQLRTELYHDEDSKKLLQAAAHAQSANLPRSHPVLIKLPEDVANNGNSMDQFVDRVALSVPYLLPSGDDILNVKVTLPESRDGQTVYVNVSVPLLRTDGWLGYKIVALHIRE